MPRNATHITVAIILCATTLLLPSNVGGAARALAAPAKAPERLLTFDTCTRVIEGDLIEGEKVGLIRLIGVIAPAKGEPGYQEAIDYTRKLAVGRQIKVEICPERPNDYRNRLRAVVYLPDSTNLNTKLLRAGMARVLKHAPCHVDVKAWRPYMTDAQEAKRGLWKPAAAPTAAVAPAKPKSATSAPAKPKNATGARVRIRPQR
ncbi:MAG TPA: hypothetical protein GX715_13905 [Armatimonadetes bacterium]|nr:hypothetical protein [Armatimonadota bacterium]